MAPTGLVLASLLAAGVTVAAFEPSLNPQTLAEAIQLGQSSVNDVRTRFHAPYHVVVAQAPVDYVEIVTPFRRVALDSEAHARTGDQTYGQRAALATLGEDPSRVDVVVELTFHPLNNYLGVPDFSVTLQPPGGDPIQPRTISRLPRFSPRISGMSMPYPYTNGPALPNGSQPLLGGSVIATFDGTVLDAKGAYVVVITGSAGDAAKARIDFGQLR